MDGIVPQSAKLEREAEAVGPQRLVGAVDNMFSQWSKSSYFIAISAESAMGVSALILQRCDQKLEKFGSVLAWIQ